MLRCIKAGIPWLAPELKTPLGHIGVSTERQLLNGRIRSINQTMYPNELKREVCYNRLKNLVEDREVLQDCQSLIHRARKSQCNKVKLRQMAKFSMLIEKQKGYMYNNNIFVRYRYGIFGDCPFSSNSLESSSTTSTKTTNSNMDVSTTSTKQPQQQYWANLTQQPQQTGPSYKPFMYSLTKPQETLLGRDPNFAVVPKYSPRGFILLQWKRHAVDSP